MLMQEHEYVQQVGKNPLLAYVMLHVIDKFQHNTYITPEIFAQLCVPISRDDTQRRVLTPQRFYRILYLIDKDCQKRGLELKLPYYWYKSGPVVHAAGAPRVYKITRLQKTQQAVASFAEWKDTILIFDGFESAYSDAILLTQNARQLGDLSKLDIVYEYSPSHTHKILITLLNELSRFQKHSVLDKRQKMVVQGLLERLIVETWESKYDDLYPVFAKGVRILYDMLKDDVNVVALISTVTALWNVFTLALRARENVNIGSKTTQRWEERYHHALDTFKIQCTSYVDKR
ncbi:MAG: hypothetical protein LUP95_04080 [Euryarchaeota archaeon]|nr:hypothetical protein [Euryarchaeota archaeon]